MGTEPLAGMLVGTPENVTKLSAAVTELIVSVPPPAFCRTRDWEVAWGFAVCAEKESTLGATESCGGAEITFNETLIVWLVPAQGPFVHVTTMEVCDRPAPRVSAFGSRETVISSGVVPPPFTSSQETAGVK